MSGDAARTGNVEIKKRIKKCINREPGDFIKKNPEKTETENDRRVLARKVYFGAGLDAQVMRLELS